MTKLGNLIKKMWNGIAAIFHKLDDITKKAIPLATKIVNAVKDFEAGDTDDIILAIVKKVIPGEADDLLISKVQEILHEVLPKVALPLNILKLIEAIPDENERKAKLTEYLTGVLIDLKFETDEKKKVFLHGLSSLLIEKLSDGKLTWSEAVAISEYAYKNLE